VVSIKVDVEDVGRPRHWQQGRLCLVLLREVAITALFMLARRIPALHINTLPGTQFRSRYCVVPISEPQARLDHGLQGTKNNNKSVLIHLLLFHDWNAVK